MEAGRVTGRMRKTLLLGSLAVAAASAGGCAYLDVKQREWIFRAQRDVHATPADHGLPHEDLWLAVKGNGSADERVHAWWIPAPEAGKPALLYLHGSRWSMSNNLFRIARLRGMGFSVLAIDYRGFGKSDGDLPSEAQAYADAQAAWELLRAREPDPGRRFVYGHSLGGAVAIELATKNGDVAGLIVESTFTSMRDMAAAMGYGGLPLGAVLTQRFDSLDKVGQLTAPVLFVHGTSDRFVPAEMSERLYAAAPEPKRLLLVASAGHSNATYVDFDRYAAAVRDLVGLAGAARAASPTRNAAAGGSG